MFPDAAATTRMQRLLAEPLGRTVVTLAPQPQSLFRRNLAAAFGADTQPDATDLAEFWQLLRFNGGHRAVAAVMHYLRDRAGRAERLVGALTRAEIPLLLLHAPGDPIVGPRTLARWRARMTRGRVAELDCHVGHYPPLEAPGHVLAAWRDLQHTLEAAA